MQYHGDMVKALLEDKSLRNVLFSYEPIQEYFIPKRNEGSKREDKTVYPWYLETFGPWPVKKNSEEIKPRAYRLKDNHDEQSALAENISYYHIEQIIKSIRKIEGAEKLPITFSGMLVVDHAGGDIETACFKNHRHNGKAAHEITCCVFGCAPHACMRRKRAIVAAQSFKTVAH